MDKIPFTYTLMHISYARKHTHMHTHKHAHNILHATHTYTHTFHMPTCTHMYACIHCMHVRTCTNTRTCAHTHTHTHIQNTQCDLYLWKSDGGVAVFFTLPPLTYPDQQSRYSTLYLTSPAVLQQLALCVRLHC